MSAWSPEEDPIPKLGSQFYYNQPSSFRVVWIQDGEKLYSSRVPIDMAPLHLDEGVFPYSSMKWFAWKRFI